MPLVHTKHWQVGKVNPVSNVDRWRLRAWLGVDASSKPKVYEQVFAATEITSLSYWLELLFSAGIATNSAGESNQPKVVRFLFG
jgi:hypothetical protein